MLIFNHMCSWIVVYLTLNLAGCLSMTSSRDWLDMAYIMLFLGKYYTISFKNVTFAIVNVFLFLFQTIRQSEQMDTQN